MVLTILTDIFTTLKQADIWIRLALSSILLVILIALSLWQNTHLETKLVWSFTRGLIQIVLLGSILSLIFQVQKIWLLYLILLFMCAFAAYTNARSYRYPKIFWINLLAITLSSMIIMTFVMFSGIVSFFEGIIPYPPGGEYVIPLGSMTIFFAMRESGVALERAKSDILKSKGKIEAALALGASSTRAIRSILRDAFRASLVPTINRVAVLGIVTIPGLMSGMIIGGAHPIEAAIYQIVVFMMLLTAAFITSIITNYLFTNQFFTREQQLDLVFYNQISQIEKSKKKGSQVFEKIKQWIQKIRKKRDEKQEKETDR
ncbi:MAG: iron export ABC transporter permease subunit FetB [Candidatus Heimdallarchaeota archaeon]|nr:iron export ABC transporter permease subunit FetB [Candidatus Heimdallarchaeota archaeon]